MKLTTASHGRRCFVLSRQFFLDYFFFFWPSSLFSFSGVIMTDSPKSFDYTNAIYALCKSVCSVVREFRTIDCDRVGFSFRVARNRQSGYGCWACVLPLRFENGSIVTYRDRRCYTLDERGSRVIATQRRYFKTRRVVGPNGQELLYIFSIMSPRFLNLSIREKIDTIMHELYHISPAFNGDVRRFPGRNWQHGNKKEYDAKAAAFSELWLASEPDPRLYDFLNYNALELRQKYGRVVGNRYSVGALIPITEQEAFRLDHRLAGRK